jgi:hypothetical protein
MTSKGTPTNYNAARQAAFRARKAAEEKTELRGIFATAEDQERIRRYVARMKKKPTTTEEHRKSAKPKI